MTPLTSAQIKRRVYFYWGLALINAGFALTLTAVGWVILHSVFAVLLWFCALGFQSKLKDE